MPNLYTSPEKGSAAVARPDAEVEVVGLGLAAAHGAHLGAVGAVVLRGGSRLNQFHLGWITDIGHRSTFSLHIHSGSEKYRVAILVVFTVFAELRRGVNFIYLHTSHFQVNKNLK